MQIFEGQIADVDADILILSLFLILTLIVTLNSNADPNPRGWQSTRSQVNSLELVRV